PGRLLVLTARNCHGAQVRVGVGYLRLQATRQRELQTSVEIPPSRGVTDDESHGTESIRCLAQDLIVRPGLCERDGSLRRLDRRLSLVQIGEHTSELQSPCNLV